ncbi:hypothetical protein QUF54_08365, partial [Candidatus Marithioploca araucensis]|nr:hypothetical protein [Candidatus Marithioploca araucensis]
LYLVMAFFGVNFDLGAEPLFRLNLPSGEEWAPSWSGIFIMFGVVALYFEIIKSTKTGTGTIVEHGLSMVVFIICLMLFLLYQPTGTSTFLIITLMSLLDVVAGFNITIASARRDFNMSS